MTFQDTDTTPKESFVYNASGLRGTSASDRLVLRDKDSGTSWNAASDSTLEERTYYLHNWRGDVVELIDDAANRVESVRYSAYGVPFGMPAGDTDNDGDGDATDDAQFTAWIGAATYDVRGDLDLDGDVDAADQATFQSNSLGLTLGREVLSSDADSGVGNRRGYASYEHDGVNNVVAHVRNRVLLTNLGRWTRRDLLGYVDGMSAYGHESISSSPPDPIGGEPLDSPNGGGIAGFGFGGIGSSPFGISASPHDPPENLLGISNLICKSYRLPLNRNGGCSGNDTLTHIERSCNGGQYINIGTAYCLRCRSVSPCGECDRRPVIRNSQNGCTIKETKCFCIG